MRGTPEQLDYLEAVQRVSKARNGGGRPARHPVRRAVHLFVWATAVVVSVAFWMAVAAIVVYVAGH